MTNENQSPVKKINIQSKDVVATEFGIGAGVVVYEAAKKVFPILVEKTVELVTKLISK